MCVAKCPSGFYANDNTTSCELCLPQLNCATCTVVVGGSGVVQCITCQYGYYMQTDNTCKTTCLPLFFKNNWRNTCDPCSANCGNCTSSADSSCIDCRAGKVFLANVSGKYCLGTCPSEYYYRSGDNCLDCYTACKTCQGTTSVDCLTCVDGLYLSNGMCRYVCPAGSYPRKSTGLCESCNTNCQFCFGPTVDNCTACVTGLVLNNFTCTTSCPTGITVNQWGVCFS